MRTVVELNGKVYEDIESAVSDVAKAKLESAVIVIRKVGNDEIVRVFEVTAETDYAYEAYTVLYDKYGDGSEWDWYQGETFYSTEKEAMEALNSAEKGNYRISRVCQTLTDYTSQESIREVVK